MKKFEQFINELKYTTYSNASKKLKEKGHIERSKEISKHSNIHSSKMLCVKNYPDLSPFEIWVNSEFFPDNINKSNKLTVYLSHWIYLPANENDCENVVITPHFIFNSKVPLIGDLSRNEHFKGIDGYLEMEDVFAFDYSNEKVSLYSMNGEESYYKFTNRRDAVRFKKLIESDPIFMSDLVGCVSGCDELNPFLIQQEFKDSIKINDLYV